MAQQFVWKESFSVNVELMDEHHRHLFTLMNQLEDAIGRKSSDDTVGRVIDSLAAYARMHFSAEEEILDNCQFSEIEIHRRQHDFFVKQVEEMKATRASLHLSGIVSFLRDWFIHHISLEDKKYGEFLNARLSPNCVAA
jgi:hemerythrin